MNSLVVLVACVAGLVHAAPSYWAHPGAAHPGAAHPGATHPGAAHPGPAHVGQAWHGPLAAPVVLPSGYLADTPDVAALKAAHVAALGGAPGAYAPHHGYAAGAAHGAKWHGPLAVPVVLPSGYLADTPDVVALRGAHAAAHGHGHGHGYYH